LTVAVDISPLWEPLTGIGWYLLRILESLAQSDEVRLRLYPPSLFDAPEAAGPQHAIPQGPALELVRYPDPVNLSLDRTFLMRWFERLEPRLVAADLNRVLFAPNYVLSARFSKAKGRLVATVHDLAVSHFPETMEASTRQALERNLDATLAKATALVTVSETVRQELIADKEIRRDKIRAIHSGPGNPPDGSKAIAALPTGEPFVLFVGTLEPRKNLRTLLDAWELLHRQVADPPVLVLCGRLGWKSESLEDSIRRAQAAGRVRALGYVESAELATWYRGALAVALPSLYEGFGLPAVEAMAVGTPLILSDIPVLREVAGDAALYVEAEDAEAWAEAVERLLTDGSLRTELSNAGLARSHLFDWDRAASQLVEVFKNAAER